MKEEGKRDDKPDLRQLHLHAEMEVQPAERARCRHADMHLCPAGRGNADQCNTGAQPAVKPNRAAQLFLLQLESERVMRRNITRNTQ